MRSQFIPLSRLAWMAALLPFLTIHVCYLIAASYGHIEWCVPYWDSCTSISAAGRELPEKLLFKLGMIPASLLTMVLWWCVRQWVQGLEFQKHHPSLRAMPWLGTLAAFFLILYTAALGEEGDAYRQLRRTGVTLSFAFTFLAQLLLTRLIGELAQDRNDPVLRKYFRVLMTLMVVLLATGLMTVILEMLIGEEGYAQVEDAFEWVLALLLNIFFAILALILSKYPAFLKVSAAN